MKKNYKENLKHITTFMFDVDGVLTDGKVMLYQGEVIRSLNSKDGYAIQYAAKMGYKIFIVTGGNSVDVKNKLEMLGVTEVHLKASHKLDVYREIQKTHKLSDEEILYMGDDIPDYQVMSSAGIAACPQDAAPEIKLISDYHSPYTGGKACVRDVIEQTMKSQDKWFKDLAFSW